MISRARVFSIGHSHHALGDLLRLLEAVGVTAVADVRSRPYSGRYPQFNRPELESALSERDLRYAFLGDSLGGRPVQMSLYDQEGRVDYERVRKTAAFQHGLQRLIDASDEHRIAMLCAEEDPLDCHRGLMIAPALAQRGVAALHLRGNGRVETNDEMERRLYAETGVGIGILDGLFAATLTEAERRALLAEAYRAMAKRKAYRLRQDETDAAG
jgi:uncharacterized protein (DUF488 family)